MGAIKGEIRGREKEKESENKSICRSHDSGWCETKRQGEKRQMYRTFCEYMQCHSTPVPKSHGWFRAGQLVTLVHWSPWFLWPGEDSSLPQVHYTPQFSPSYFNGTSHPARCQLDYWPAQRRAAIHHTRERTAERGAQGDNCNSQIVQGVGHGLWGWTQNCRYWPHGPNET